jgi:hypothetical protein
MQASEQGCARFVADEPTIAEAGTDIRPLITDLMKRIVRSAPNSSRVSCSSLCGFLICHGSYLPFLLPGSNVKRFQLYLFGISLEISHLRAPIRSLISGPSS